jgi:hypothetical protein
MAPADHGLVNIIEGFGTAGLPGCREAGLSPSRRRVGESHGEEKERR